MKKLLFSTLFLVMLIPNILNADEVKEKTTEELIAEFMKLDKEVEEEKAKTLAEKRESESARKIGRKLDELKGVLTN